MYLKRTIYYFNITTGELVICIMFAGELQEIAQKVLRNKTNRT